ncbi:MAG: M1 family metallopeptidase [Salibacter sp.]|uniref:M1 family metallopeptidase n=1 Tax=Salibacter sp. TaxID=2010995 RepID=UPI00286FEF79|nr:M1 family metallopeptidase [Salibacter sp.]MDR9398629.1 M1 family metallopeptidase [Salibacter sp.]
MRYTNIALLFIVGLLIASCGSKETKTEMKQADIPKDWSDPHSYAKPLEAAVKHLNWIAQVSFKTKKIKASATWDIENNNADSIVFDTRNLDIHKVLVDGADEADYYLGDNDPVLGQPLVIKLPEGAEWVAINYSTSKDAEALQWLNAQQTHDKNNPFLFTQSQAILARTWIPCQDSPGIRFTYEAEVKSRPELLTLMSAENPVKKNADGIYKFKMTEPIPSYLMAMAIGDVEFQKIGEQTGVYAEPGMIEASANEFANMDSMLVAAEKLYGKYRWGRYDVIVLPPSFPFGGMENPRLTFSTPTIIAGDRSLTSLIAHELAHSWSGNLVTNANWNDFWLNEGFTVYFERRIMEELYGKDYVNMLRELGMQDLKKEVADLPARDTWLKLDLDGRNPDDGMTSVAYEKGAFFLEKIEELYGRKKFDKFLNTYFEKFAFETMTTEKFVSYLDSSLLSSDTALKAKLRLNDWIYGPGIPDNAPEVTSERFQRVESALKAWSDGAFEAKELKTAGWSSHEWLHFLRNLPDTLSNEQMSELDQSFGFTKSGNSEILAAWFEHTIKHNYKPADDALESFLVSVGRRKFLVPLYSALTEADPSKKRATAIYKKARPNYHSVSTNTIDEMLNYQKDKE